MASLVKWLLIVDDEEDILEVVSSLIDINFGDKVKVVQARDGLEATNKLHFQAFDCIVTDLVMPRKEGEAFIDSTRQSNLNAHTPIIVLTAHVNEALIEKYPHLHVLEKPMVSEKLIELIGNQIKLGRTDKRVEAHLLNTVTSAVQSFLNKLVNDEPEQLYPRPKKAGDIIENEVVRRFIVKSGQNQTTFLLGFPKECLEVLAKSVDESTSEFDYEHLAGAAGGIIIKRAISSLQSAAVSVLESQSFVRDKHPDEYKKLSKEKGLTLPLKTSSGTIEVHALW